MKIILSIILIIFLSANTFAQNRRAIIKQIDRFRNAELYNATFDIELDSLKYLLGQYFAQNKYKRTSESDSVMRFYTRIRVRNAVRGGAYPTSYYRCIRYLSSTLYVYVTAAISNVKGRKKITISSKRVNYTNSNTTDIYLSRASHYFDELSLRRFLYESCFGTTIELSSVLSARVNHYNATQTKERKKLICGRHY